MPVSTAIIWLKAASALLMIGFGLMFAIAAFPSTAVLAIFFVDLLIWPIDGAQSLAGTEVRIVLAIGGGITVGWGVLVWQVAGLIMPTYPRVARNVLLSSLVSWFVVDSICSILAGVSLNALANAGFLAIFLWPLCRMTPTGDGPS